MATITPTLTLASNASTAGTPGPLSISLTLKTEKALTTGTLVESGVAGVTTTHTDNQIYTVGSNAAYVYLHNRSDVTIYVGSSGAAADRFNGLKEGEFGFFPWAGEQDIYLYHLSAGLTKDCEFWVFYE